MRKSEIKQLSPEERAERLSELRTELVRLRTMAVSGGSVEDPNRIKETKKTIARILTIENAKESKRREH